MNKRDTAKLHDAIEHVWARQNGEDMTLPEAIEAIREHAVDASDEVIERAIRTLIPYWF